MPSSTDKRGPDAAGQRSGQGSGRGSGQGARQSTRQRAAEMRRKEKQRERQRRIAARAGIAVAVLAVGGGVAAIALTGNGGRQTAKVATLPAPNAVGSTALPPWPAPTDVAAAVHSAGLTLLSSEGVVQHYHAHLDVLVNGKAVAVPAAIGIDQKAQSISALHTHDASGVLHIEAPNATSRFTLGQAFDEWGVLLDSTQLGGLTTGGGKTLTTYVNGTKFTGNPAAIELKAHEEIAVVYGDANAKVTAPSSYSFPAGD